MNKLLFTEQSVVQNCSIPDRGAAGAPAASALARSLSRPEAHFRRSEDDFSRPLVSTRGVEIRSLPGQSAQRTL